jgi:hypothetical protein
MNAALLVAVISTLVLWFVSGWFVSLATGNNTTQPQWQEQSPDEAEPQPEREYHPGGELTYEQAHFDKDAAIDDFYTSLIEKRIKNLLKDVPKFTQDSIPLDSDDWLNDALRK